MMEKLKEMLSNLKSRKVILLILGIIYGILTVFKDQLGFSLEPEAVVTTLAVIIIYIFGEGKADMKRLQKGWFQGEKWKEPQFWLSLLGAILPIATTIFGFKIPVDKINGVLAIVLGFLFKKKSKKLN